MVKKIISIIMIFILFSSPITVNGASLIDISTANQFSLTISNAAKTNKVTSAIDLSGIKIDVYSSTLSSYDSVSKISEYTHTYAFSVNTNSEGTVCFTRPSSFFLIIVDLTTLPENMGIDIQTKFYRDDTCKDILYLSEIDDVVIELNEMIDNGISVTMYNEQGEPINAHYTISKTEEQQSGKSILDSSSQILSGNVHIGESVKSYRYEIQYSKEQKMSQIETALTNGSISKNEALSFYIDCFEKYGRSPELYEKVSMLKSDSVWFETLPLTQQNSVKAILSAPSYNKEFTSGYFTIRYTSSSSSTPTFITSLMSAIQTADASLVGGLSLNRPKSVKTGTAKYYIYVTSDVADSVSYCLSDSDTINRTSYIVFPNITDLTDELSEFLKGSAAHEYMHAITNDYRHSSTLPQWFKEAWADWAAVRVFGIDAAGVNRVNNYLNYIYLSLTSNEITYGKFLYPLYIRQELNGDTTVANVIKNLSSTNDVKIAITNALPGNNTFNSIFSAYMRYNYAPKYFYSPSASGWNNRPFLSADYPLNGYPNNMGLYTLQPYAAHYREFAVPSGESYHLDITINLTESSPTFSGKLLMNGSSGVITNWNFTVSGTLVTCSTNIGVSYVKGGLMLVDSGSDAITGYRITIARN